MQKSVLEGIASKIDIVESFNGRARFRGKTHDAERFATTKQIPQAASSDAHCFKGIGSALSIISAMPVNKSLKNLLKEGDLQKQYAPLLTLLCPAYNKIKNKIVLGV